MRDDCVSAAGARLRAQQAAWSGPVHVWAGVQALHCTQSTASRVCVVLSCATAHRSYRNAHGVGVVACVCRVWVLSGAERRESCKPHDGATGLALPAVLQRWPPCGSVAPACALQCTAGARGLLCVVPGSAV